MTHRQLITEVCTCIIDALGLQIEPSDLSVLVEASLKEKRRFGAYGVLQNDVEYAFERLKRDDRDTCPKCKEPINDDMGHMCP